ncbi:MAG TPA: hypothetical protein VFG59_04940, partial [Anaeromyxobacter sp.]|nr:hypothetical protein [Anaeromyxobacter sp.]
AQVGALHRLAGGGDASPAAGCHFGEVADACRYACEGTARAERESVRVLLRIFCHAHGHKLILLLGAYDKGEYTSPRRQDAESALARARLRDWRRRQATGERADS